jgi:hypothetical protein
MRKPIAALLLAVVVLGSLTTSVADAFGRRTTYVTFNCLRVRTEPSSIMFACGDGNSYVDHLTWTRWHRWEASGFGLFHQNDCRPNCAEGTFHTVWGRIWLRSRVRCDRPDAYVFEHARVRYDHRFLGRRKTAFRLQACPLR